MILLFKRLSIKKFSSSVLAFFCLLLLSTEAISKNKLNEMRIGFNSQEVKIRIVFDADKKIDYKFNKVLKKNIIKVSLINIDTVKNFKSPNYSRKYIKKLKLSRDKENLNFYLKTNNPIKYKYFSLKPNGRYGHRFVIDIYLNKKVRTTLIEPKIFKSNKVVIAIDAGHGGKDPGAVGKNGTLEKDIVLSISKKLYNLLRKERNIKPILIRNKDSYMSLRQRINKARRNKADLFISIHADAAKNRKAKGSSVYVLSQHGASSEAAKWLADKENSSDLLGGASIDDKDNELAQVILDMSQSVTIETSLKASRIMLKNLKKVSKLHLKNIGQAGFVVLKSPDIPSMLIETAFLSNAKEEKKLRTKKFQKNIARAIRDGILEIIKKGII